MGPFEHVKNCARFHDDLELERVIDEFAIEAILGSAAGVAVGH